MGALVDIHAHVLPGIDDGPEDLEQSLEMARAAAECGIEAIASTPHLRSDFPRVHVRELGDRCRSLTTAIDAACISLKVVSAAEISLTWALSASDEELRLASYGQRGSDLLVEAPTVNAAGIDGVLYELRAGGYRVTLGHPERSTDFQEDAAKLRLLVEQGILLQINADSLLGPATRGTKRLARELVTSGLAHAIASDAHRGTKWRPVTRLREAIDVASSMVGIARANWMGRAVPHAIMTGEGIPEPPPIAPVQRRPRRLFGLNRR